MNIKKVFGLVLSVVVLFLHSCGNNEKKENTENSAKNSQSTVIAKMEGNKIVFTNKEKLILQLESALVTSKKLDVKVMNLTIDYSKAIDNDIIDIIQLIGSNDDSSVQISYQLEKTNNEFRIVSKSSTLVCEGCRSGCSPRRKTNGDGYCTKCDYSSASKCVKTETAASYTE